MFKVVDVWGETIKTFSDREDAEQFLKGLNIWLRYNCTIIVEG